MKFRFPLWAIVSISLSGSVLLGQEPTIVVQSGHEEPVTQMHYLPESQLLTSLSTNNIRPVVFKIWDVITRRLVKDIALPMRKANYAGGSTLNFSQGSGQETFDFVNTSMLKIFHNDTIPNKISMLNIESEKKSTFVADWMDDFFTTTLDDELVSVKVFMNETWFTRINTRTEASEQTKASWGCTSPFIAFDARLEMVFIIGNSDFKDRDKAKLCVYDLKHKKVVLDTVIQKDKDTYGYIENIQVRPWQQKILMLTDAEVFVLDYQGRVLFTRKEKTDGMLDFTYATLHPDMPIVYLAGYNQKTFWDITSNTLIKEISPGHPLRQDFHTGEFVEHEKNMLFMNKIPYIYNLDTDELTPFNKLMETQGSMRANGLVSLSNNAFYYAPAEGLGSTVFSWNANGLMPRKYSHYPNFGSSTASEIFRYDYYKEFELKYSPPDSVSTKIHVFSKPDFEKARTIRLSSKILPAHQKDTYIVHVFEDGNRVVYRDGSTYQEYDLKARKKLRKWTWKDIDTENFTRFQQFHWVNEEPYVSIVSNEPGSKSTIVQLKTGKTVYEKVKTLRLEDNPYAYPTFSVLNQYAVSLSVTNSTYAKAITAIDVFNFTTGTLRTIPMNLDIHSFQGWAIGQEQLLVSLYTGELFAWTLTDGKLLKHWRAHNNTISGVSYSQDKRFILSQDAGGLVKIWKADDFSFQLGLFVGRFNAEIETLQAECLFFTPDGYYFAPKSLLQLMAFRVGNHAFPVEQFDLKYNRPDKVLEKLRAMGLEGITQNQIDYYKKSYLKRLSLNNLKEDQLSPDFHLPATPKITSKIPLTVSDKQLAVEVLLEDAQEKLNTLFVTVNGVPVLGTKGMPLKNPSHQWKEKVILTLSRGKNVIEFSALNDKGAESLKTRVEVNYTATTPSVKKVHLVTIGVSQYQDSKMNLKYASKDATDIQAFFTKNLPKQTGHEIISHVLVDEAVTKANVMALKEKLNRLDVDDVVLVFISGHGVLDKNLDYYLATHHLNFSNPAEHGLAYEDLENLLDGIPPRQKVLMIDACHSGELDKEDIAITASSSSTNGAIKFRDFGMQVKNKTVGLQNSFELSKQLFSDLRKTNGTTVISAASGVEYAIEGDVWQNGVFTYALLSGLQDKKADLNNDGAVYLSELQKYLQARVPELTQGKQTPTSRAENMINDFRIW
jgi:uncharacterized caspase-like protein/WD40 repeat protein